MSSPISSYLAVGRLADVLALIQLLAFDSKGYPCLDRMTKKLGRKPISADDWLEVARAHPEFFRVRSKEDDSNKKERAALIIRYVVGKVEDDNGDKARPALTPVMASNLFSIAADLHDKQVNHRDRWKPWIFALVGTLLGALATIVAAGLKATAG